MRRDSSEDGRSGSRAAHNMRDLADVACGDERAGLAQTRRQNGLKAARDQWQREGTLVGRPLPLEHMDVQFPVESETKLYA